MSFRSRGTFPVLRLEPAEVLVEGTGDAGLMLSSNFLVALTLPFSIVLLLGSTFAEDESLHSEELVIVRGAIFGDDCAVLLGRLREGSDNSSTNTGTFFCAGFVLEANCTRLKFSQPPGTKRNVSIIVLNQLVNVFVQVTTIWTYNLSDHFKS